MKWMLLSQQNNYILSWKFNIEKPYISRENIWRIQLIPPSDCKKHSRPHSNYSPPSSRFPNSSVRLSVRSSPPARRIIKTQIETRTIIHEILARGHETKPGLIRPLIRPVCPPASFLRFALRGESHNLWKTKHSKLRRKFHFSCKRKAGERWRQMTFCSLYGDCKYSFFNI